MDTGAPLTVIPHRIHQLLTWQPLNLRTTWRGIPCAVGSIQAWLPVSNYSVLRGPLPVVAKFPDHDPPGDPIPVLLGLEFFQSHSVLEFVLRAPAPGSIRIP